MFSQQNFNEVYDIITFTWGKIEVVCLGRDADLADFPLKEMLYIV